MGQIVELLQDILHPSKEYTPIPFWFFNDAADEEKIRKQLEDYVEKGVNGIVLHPRIGVPKELVYLSEAYFGVVKFIVKTAEQLQMKVVLYDEGMYPSGSAHGMVVAQNPEFASKGITLLEKEAELALGEQLITRLADGRKLVYGFTHGTIRGIHFGEDDGEVGAPVSADILNPEAVETFIELTHEQYYAHLKEYFGNTIIAFFTDEPCALGRNAVGFREWVAGMEEELVAAGGQLEELVGLFEKRENDTTVIYRKLIKKHLREIFYARLSKWCETHGIALMGHPEVSDDIEEELYFHIPGQDLIMRRVSPETGGVTEFDSVQAKLSADIARHLGRRRNANECFGVCVREQISWFFTASDMKWYIDWLGVRGVNLFVPHAFYYSVEGRRKDERPPDVGPNNIWWKYYHRFSDYMKRVSYIMTDSVECASVAVLCDNNRVPYRELAALYEKQIGFHYLPVAFLKECCIKDGKLCTPKFTYDYVLNVMDAEWNMYLAQLPREGNLQELTVLSDAELLWKDERIQSIKVQTYEPTLRVAKLIKNETRMYLLSNEGETTIQTNVVLEEAEAYVIVDLWKGSYCVQNGQSAVALNLQPRETRLFIVDDNGVITSERYEQKQEKNLGDWTTDFLEKTREQNSVTYQLVYVPREIQGGEYFTLNAEEMVECYCNGYFVDVSFWGMHRFDIGAFLQKGQNEITVICTGNAANIYSGANIPFGVK